MTDQAIGSVSVDINPNLAPLLAGFNAAKAEAAKFNRDLEQILAKGGTRVSAPVSDTTAFTAAQKDVQNALAQTAKITSSATKETAALGVAAAAARAEMATSGRVSVETSKALGGYQGVVRALTAETVKGTSATKDAEAAQAKLAARALALRASLDPLAKAQQLLASRTQEAKDLFAAGAISEAENIGLQGAAQKAYEETAKSIAHVGTNSRATFETFVLGREALRGNFTRMAGSVSILASALGIIPILLNPIILGTAAVAGAMIAGTVAANQYAASLHALNAEANGIGRATGASAAAIQAGADVAAKAANVSVSSAEKQIAAYVATGKIGVETATALAAVTEKYAAAMHVKGADAAKELATALADPAKGAEDLQKQLGLLTDSQLREVEAAAAAGDRLKAQRILTDALTESLGTVETHMNGFAGAMHTAMVAGQNLWRAIGWLYGGAPQATGGLDQQIAQLRAAAARPPLLAMLTGDTARQQVIAQQIARLQAQKGAPAAIATNEAVSAARAALPDSGVITDLIAKQKQWYDALHSGTRLSAADLATTQHAYAAVSDAIKRVTDDQGRYIPQAAREHEIALLQVQEAKATKDHNTALSGQIKAKITLLQTGSDLVTNQEAQTKATDAGALAAEHATKSGNGHAAQLAREAASIDVNTKATLDAASAYLQGTAAGDAAVASAKALTAATKEGLSPAQAAAKVASEQALADAEATKALAQKATATADQVAAQSGYNDKVAAGTMTAKQASDALAIDNALRTDEIRLLKLSGDQRAVLTAAIDKMRAAMLSANVAAAEQQLLSGSEGMKDQLETLRLEATLIGATNKERAVALAQLKAEQDLRHMNFSPAASAAAAFSTAKASGLSDQTAAIAGMAAYKTADEWAKKYTADSKAAAAQTDANTVATDTHNASLTRTLDLLTQMDQRAQTLGQGLASAFGTAGSALGGLMTAMTGYAAQQEKINVDQTAALLKIGITEQSTAEDRAKVQGALTDITVHYANERTNAELAHTGAVLDATKNLFSQQSGAYKAMQVIQQVYYAFQFAAQAQAMAKDIAHTVSSVANSMTRGAADEAAGAAKMFSFLGPFAFPIVAAMVAVLAGLGLKGSSGSAPAFDLKAEQDAQGTGTVLGSPAAKSDSVAKSLDAASKNLNTMMEYQSGMLTALRSIDANIGSLTSVLARQLGLAGGAFDTSKLGLGTTKSAGFLGLGNLPLIGGLFGSTTTKTLQDQGLQFNSQSLADMLASAVSGQTFQQVLVDKVTKFLGITIGHSQKVQTTTGALPADLAAQIQLVVGSLRDGIVQAAGVLGVQGAQHALDSFQVSLGKLSFKDMDAQQIQDQLNAVFGKLGDQMAAAIVPEIGKFQQAGEGMMATLVRLAREYQVVDVALAASGLSFAAVGVASLEARDRLVQLAGGLDAFTSQADFYTKNFLTDAEQLAPIAASVKAAMAGLGLSVVTTKDQFKAVIQSLDLTSAGGAELYSALMAVAPAFAKVADAAAAANDNISTLTQNISDLTSSANTAIDQQISQSKSMATAAHTAADAYRAAGATMLETARQLRGGALSTLSPEQKLAEARTNLDTTFQKGLGGDTASLQAFPQILQDFLTASRGYNASTTAYAQDFQRGQAMLTQLAMSSQTDAGVMDYQAQLLDTQTGLLTAIKDELAKPDPNTAILNQQAGLLANIGQLLQAQTGQLITVNSNLTDQSGLLLVGNSIVSAQTGQIVAINIAGAQSVSAAVQAQTGQVVTGNTILNAQTGQLTNVNSAITTQTGQVIVGNTGQDAVKNLTQLNATYSAQMLGQLAASGTSQTSYLASITGGISASVIYLGQIAAALLQRNDAQAAQVAASVTDAGAAAKAAAAVQAHGNARAAILAGDPAALAGFGSANADLQSAYQNNLAAEQARGETWLQYLARQYREEPATEQNARALFVGDVGMGHAGGGLIIGPGTGTSDSILTPTSNGEFVVTAQATARNREVLEAMNRGAQGIAPMARPVDISDRVSANQNKRVEALLAEAVVELQAANRQRGAGINETLKAQSQSAKKLDKLSRAATRAA